MSPRIPRPPSAALAAALLLLPLLARAAGAQGTRPAGAPPGVTSGAATGEVAGVVYDSLFAERPLADAEVWVEGTNLTARTDGSGRFRLAGIPAGTRRLTFYHPSLESLGISAPPRAVDVPGGGSTAVTLVTPSPAAVHGALCPASREPKTGVLVGRVRSGEPPEPVEGGSVALQWNVFTLGKQGFVRQTREVAARTAADGTFWTCEVPSDVSVQVRVQAPDGLVSVVEASLGDRPFGVSLVDLPALPTTVAAEGPAVAGAAAAAPVTERGVVVGVIRTPKGVTVAGAIVEARESGARTTTGPGGVFTLRNVRPGSNTVEARAIGFRPVRTRVTVDADAPTRVALTVSDAVVVLAPTRVTAPRVQAMLAGFEQRRKGGSGVFFTAEQIAQRRPYSVNDMLIQVPGVQVTFPDGQTPGASPQVVFQRSLGQGGVMLQQCTPTTFIDGVRFAPDISGGIDVLLRPQEVHGIEVYRNLASAPQQFQTLDSSCGVILIWTRRGS